MDPLPEGSADDKSSAINGAPKELPEGVEIVNGQYVTRGEDGVSYEWDSAKQAWFPMWQDDLVTLQQSAYGTWQPDPATVAAEEKAKERIVDEEEEEYYDEDDADLAELGAEGASGRPHFAKNRKEKPAGGKFGKGDKQGHEKEKVSSVVYVTGLPEDITIEEMKEFFSKCGLIKIDFETDVPKIKLYRDEKGNIKGDGWVSYLKPESVPLAIQILDQADIRPGKKVTVSPAQFDHQVDPKKKRKVDKRLIKQKMHQLEKKLEWFDEGSGTKAKYARVVILKHMFTLDEFDKDPGLIIDLKSDIREECGKLGEVSSVMLFERSSDGVCSVKFKEEEAAKNCVERMNGRYFAGRRVEAEIYDGKTKYASKASGEEADKEEAARLENFAKWLETKD